MQQQQQQQHSVAILVQDCHKNSVPTIMAEQFILFSSESENEGRRGARTFSAPAVSITAPAPVEEYIAQQTGEEETLKKAIEIMQTIPHRVPAALAQRRRGSGTEEFEGVVLRIDQFAASEAKRLHSEGLQLLAVRIVCEVTKQIKDLIVPSAPAPVVGNIAPAAILRQNSLRGAMPSGMRNRPSVAEKCDTRAARVVAARLGYVWRKSKQVERAACDRLLADMGTVLQYRDELAEIGPVLAEIGPVLTKL